MEFYLSFALAIAVIIATVLLAIFCGKNTSGWIRILGVGIIITDAVLLLPLSFDGGVPNVALSLLRAFQTGSLDADYEAFIKSAEGNFFRPYGTLLTSLLVLSPIMFGSMILTLFDKVMTLCGYFGYSLFRDAYYFSELNGRALTLADSVRRQGDGFIVFCGVTDDNPLHGEAKKRGYLLYDKKICDFKFRGLPRRGLNFYMLSEDSNADISDIRRLIDRFEKEKNKGRIKILLFTALPETEIIMDATDKHELYVAVINEPVTIAYNLLFEIPLYTALEATGDKKLSVLVVGAGRVGLEFVKAAAWCGQMDGVPLEINAVDINAEWIHEKFKMECPELAVGEYNIRFHTADARTQSLEETLSAKCRDANYIVVSLGDEALNIKTAIFLRGYYLRTSEAFSREPVICVRVSDAPREAMLTELTAINRNRIIEKEWRFNSDNAQNYNLKAFGAYDSVYSCHAIVNSPIEGLAKNVHAAYERIFNPGIATDKILPNYNVNEVGKWSSRANAIHIRYKLFSLGFEMRPRGSVVGEEAEEAAALEALKKILDAPESLTKMAEAEHYRWNAFQRSQGYRGATVEEAEKYSARTQGSHIHRRAKLHASICGWEELKLIAERFDKNMFAYDKALIRQIPSIIGAEQNEDNLGGADFVVIRAFVFICRAHDKQCNINPKKTKRVNGKSLRP